jgi:hypothetical protein
MLPATVDPTRQNVTTSYGEATTPEQALAVAVILQAVSDLTSKDEQERFEAHEFFLQPKGSWAYWRRFYFQAVNLDDEWLRQHLEHRLTPPERPDRKWTYQEVLEILPRDRAFTSADEAKNTSLHPTQFNTRIQFLIRAGDVVRLEPGLFCVTEFEDQYRRDKPVILDGTTPQNKVLAALQDGPLTAREIQIATETGHWEMLRVMVEKGLIEKDGTKYQLVPQTVVAA